MKRLFYITSVIVLSCVVASSLIIPLTAKPAPEKNPQYIISESEYIIKAQGDRIVVFKGKEEKPYLRTTTAVSSLPKDIQQRLTKGISYPTESAMKKALDEFCS